MNRRYLAGSSIFLATLLTVSMSSLALAKGGAQNKTGNQRVGAKNGQAKQGQQARQGQGQGGQRQRGQRQRGQGQGGGCQGGGNGAGMGNNNAVGNNLAVLRNLQPMLAQRMQFLGGQQARRPRSQGGRQQVRRGRGRM